VIEGQSQLRAGAKVSARAGARPGAKAPTVPATSDAPARRDRKGGAPP